MGLYREGLQVFMDPPNGAVALATEGCVGVDSEASPSYLEIQQAMSGNEHKCGCISHQRLSKFGQFKNGTLKVSFGKSVYGFQRTEGRTPTPTYFLGPPTSVLLIRFRSVGAFMCTAAVGPV